MIKENFTIVIPAYNEEGTIRDVVKREQLLEPVLVLAG
jgi:glycosyltransferase involved in cell wall biosynthesis